MGGTSSHSMPKHFGPTSWLRGEVRMVNTEPIAGGGVLLNKSMLYLNEYFTYHSLGCVKFGLIITNILARRMAPCQYLSNQVV